MFVPVNQHTQGWFYWSFLSHLWFMVTIVALPFAILFLILNGNEITTFLEDVSLFGLLVMAPLTVAFPISLLFFDREFRKESYPDMCYNLIKLRLTFFGGKIKKEKIEKHCIIDNKFMIPMFENVGLNYKVTKDFSKFLKRIQIKNIFKKNDVKWFAVFYFSKKPTKGLLEIEYI